MTINMYDLKIFLILVWMASFVVNLNGLGSNCVTGLKHSQKICFTLYILLNPISLCSFWCPYVCIYIPLVMRCVLQFWVVVDTEFTGGDCLLNLLWTIWVNRIWEERSVAKAVLICTHGRVYCVYIHCTSLTANDLTEQLLYKVEILY